MVSREGWYADVPAAVWMEDPVLLGRGDAETGDELVLQSGVIMCQDDTNAILVSCGGLIARVPKDANPARIVWKRRDQRA